MKQGTLCTVIRAGTEKRHRDGARGMRFEWKAWPQAPTATSNFPEILAVSGSEGQIGKPQSEARVVGEVMEEGRSPKILVFHYKRKKQYKKLRGHRQSFTAVRITEIAFDGQSFKAPELPKKQPKPKKAAAADEHESEVQTGEAPAKKSHAKKKAAPKKAARRGRLQRRNKVARARAKCPRDSRRERRRYFQELFSKD